MYYNRNINITQQVLTINAIDFTNKKSPRLRRSFELGDFGYRNYNDSVNVRVITSRCCSGVKELKRTA